MDTAFGAINKRNHIREIDTIQLPEKPIDCYKTYFRFDEVFIDHFNRNNKSVGKYPGKCISDFIPIDIDNPNLNESLRIAKDFVNYLYYDFDVEYESLGIYFTGSKGFHIEIPVSLLGEIEPSENLPLRYKNFIQSFDNWGFDNHIYEKVRLWRIENSINSKTGLYKVRLQPQELLNLSIDEIKEIAQEPRNSLTFAPYDDCDTNQYLLSAWEETASINAPKASISFVNPKDNIEFLDNGVSEGNRNNKAFEYAKKLKNLGYKQSKTTELLCQWNLLNDPPEVEKVIKRHIHSVYTFNISDSDSIGIRRLFRSEFYKKFNSVQRDIYTQILSRINNKLKAWEWNGKMHVCNPGEMICSLQSLANHCAKEVSRNKVRHTLDLLENEGRIIMERLDGKNGTKIRLLGFECAENRTPKGGI